MLRRKYGNVNLIGVNKKNFLNKDLQKLENHGLVLVAIGHPHQETLIYKKILKLAGVKIVLGIGGTLDYWTQRKKRAPRIFQIFGLEWVCRLIMQLDRIIRVYRSVVKFPVLGTMEIFLKIPFEKEKYEK